MKQFPAAGSIACLYGRRSKDEGQEQSLRTQDTTNRGICQEHQWPVGLTIEDDGISRAEFKKRFGLTEVLQAARAGKFSVLVVYMSSRLGGDVVRTLTLLEELHDLGIAVVYSRDRKVVSLESAMDKMVACFDSFGDEREHEEVVKRTRGALKTKVLKGEAVQGPAYGYRSEVIPGVFNKTGTTCSRWVVDDAEAAVVQHIFAEYARGEGLLNIAKGLNARGVKPPMRSGERSASGWSRQTVRGLLTRTRYVGYMTHGASERGYQKGTNIRKKRAERDVMRVETPVIVSQDVWARVQLRLEGNPRYGNALVKRGRKPKYLLVGIAKCATCGGPIYGHQRKLRGEPRIVYICGKYRDQGKAGCASGLLVNEPKLNEQVLTALQSLFDSAFTTRVFAGMRDALQAQAREQPSQRAEQEKRATQLRKEMGRLRKALAATDDDEGILEDYTAKKKELAQLELELAVAPAAHDLALKNIEVLEQRARDAFASLRASFAASPDQARAVLESVFEGKLSVSKTGVSGQVGEGLLTVGEHDPEMALPRSPHGHFGIAPVPFQVAFAA